MLFLTSLVLLMVYISQKVGQKDTSVPKNIEIVNCEKSTINYSALINFFLVKPFPPIACKLTKPKNSNISIEYQLFSIFKAKISTEFILYIKSWCR